MRSSGIRAIVAANGHAEGAEQRNQNGRPSVHSGDSNAISLSDLSFTHV
jgi:hypothetical protein